MEDAHGNRGKCAQPCRLPYELLVSDESSGTFDNNIRNEKIIDKGYLLSSRDLCSLEYLPTLIKLGINSFKVEGRMKTPEYVATITRIYRKYIDLALSGKKYVIDEHTKKDLLQVFNRGGFSSGHLSSEANRNLIYPEKPDNMGLYIGNISNYNSNKGHITLKLNESVSVGDCISVEGETGKYTISELMSNNINKKSANVKDIVKLGRMKGNIRIGSKVYKITDKALFDYSNSTFANNVQTKKIPVICTLTVRKNTPISMKLKANVPPFYNNICVKYVSNIIPEEATNFPISKDRLQSQISKLGNTPYIFEKVKIELDDNLYIPSISSINNIRRTAISMLEEKVFSEFSKTRATDLDLPEIFSKFNSTLQNIQISKSADLQSVKEVICADRKISILLEKIDTNYDYSKLENIDNVYIPLKFLTNSHYEKQILDLSNKFNIFVYMPTIIKPNYKNLLLNNLDNILSKFNIKGFVISNISGFMLLKNYMSDEDLSNYIFIANYTMNIFNKQTINELQKIGINIVTPSVELNKKTLQKLCKDSTLPVELITYGRTILMNTSYCLLGKSNKCYPECTAKCTTNSKFYLKDRLGFKFRIIPDNVQTVTSIYNSKITSIDTSDISISSLRINILDESIDEINNIIKVVKTYKKLEGKDYTNGNLNKDI